ncbi:hypothetical protein GCM10010361_14560 [Streptomyces olivaceiscleroticus]|uniref:Tetratricopeptide repeat protein n=1 Tax=Streptomyces olivaceiscleroticus TaxID=68245 RepID=A0ABN0ZL63_9ACTN
MHPAIRGATEEEDDGAFVLPDYIQRHHDWLLRKRLDAAVSSEQPTLMLVRGESCTGKTRSAFEAVRTCMKGWQLVFPKTAGRLLALLDAGGPAPRTVLWLNEMQNYLTGADGEEAAAALRGCLELPGPLMVLGTLWPEYHRILTATPPAGQDTHANARALLGQVKPVDVPASFPAKLLKDPRMHRDGSLARAMGTSTGNRIAQTLAAGPQLVDHYQQATEPHGPYGHAVITAAMDARRLGYTSPLPAAFLEAAAPGYLSGQQRAAADPAAWFAGALGYAREKVKGVAAALEPVADSDRMGALPGVYHLSDYLDHHARDSRRRAFPPESFWSAVRSQEPAPDELAALADASRTRHRYRIAADLYQRAIDAGDTRCLRRLAELHEQAGHLQEAEQLYRRGAAAGDASALVELALRRARGGDLDGAERLAQQAAAAGDARALVELAVRCTQAGDLDGAERLAQQAAAAGSPYALMELAVRRGDSETAEALTQQAIDAGDPMVLMALSDLVGQAMADEQVGQEEWGTTGPLGLAESALQSPEDITEEELWDEAIYGDEDLALRSEAQAQARFGDFEESEQLLLEAADAGDASALTELARLREEAGDFEAAEQLFRFGLEADGSPATPW